jgi:hypothetical protein
MRKITLALVAAFAFSASAQAQVIAEWGFSDFGANVTNATFGPLAATGGVNASGAVLNGVHASSSTVWSHPVGNGNADSLSANNWTSGDYFEFNLATTGFTDLAFSFDQTRSATGPANFSFRYSLDGSTFTTFSDYEVSVITWNATTPNPASTFSYDLSGVSSLNNQGSVYFRLVSLDTAAATGASRIDNVVITGVPEPSTYAMLALAGAGLAGHMIRRRRR